MSIMVFLGIYVVEARAVLGSTQGLDFRARNLCTRTRCQARANRSARGAGAEDGWSCSNCSSENCSRESAERLERSLMAQGHLRNRRPDQADSQLSAAPAR